MMNHGNMDMDHENGMMMSKNDSGMDHMMKVSILPFGFIFWQPRCFGFSRNLLTANSACFSKMFLLLHRK